MITKTVSPRFVETVEIGSSVLPSEFTREAWAKFIAEVRAGKHDWPGEKPNAPVEKRVILQVENGMPYHLGAGDTFLVGGNVVRVLECE